MRKTSKVVLMLVILCIVAILSGNVKAGVTDTDTGEGEILRKTTTNYYTTIKLEGTLNNEVTGTTENFTRTSEELTGNTDNDEVMATISSLKNEFTTWAKGLGATDIKFDNEEVSDYYYDVHDEITQSNLDTSDVILVGDMNDIDNAYASQGTITINTILDKHQTYTIKASATVEDSTITITEVNVTLESPIIGDKVTAKMVDYGGYGEYVQDNMPKATAETNANYTVDDTAWIKGTYKEAGDEFEEYFDGTFEADTYYYADIYISAKEGYKLASDLTIKVNGESPAEVFAVYGSGSNTFFIAKIKAQEKANTTEPEKITEELKEETKTEYTILNGANQTFTIDKSSDLTVRASGEIEKFLRLELDGKTVDTSNYTVKSGSTIATLNASYLNTLSTGTHTLTFVYNDGNVSTNFTVANTTSNNPKTGDNIIIYVSVFAFATIFGTFMIIRKNRKQH